MPQVIQCPQCDKKFRLPENPPATFTCNQCGTLMDLSDFGGEEPAAVPALAATDEVPARGAPAGGAGASGSTASGSTASGPSPHRHRPRRRRRPARGRGAGDEGNDDEQGGHHHHYQHKRDNTPLIIGGVAAFVLVAIFVAMSMSKDDEPDPVKAAGGSTVSADPNAGLTTIKGPGKAGAPGTVGGLNPDGTPIELTADGARKKNSKRRGKRIRLSGLDLQTFDWPEEVDAETQQKVEDALVGLYRGGRDGLDAVEYLVAQGRPICGRLISEFKTMQDGPGFGNMEAKSKLGAIDGTLRKIDGWIERKWKENKVIKHHSTSSFVTGIAKRWTYWWMEDVWKDDPMKPWDPTEDESDDTADGRKAPEKKKRKKSGYGKRAGG